MVKLTNELKNEIEERKKIEHRLVNANNMKELLLDIITHDLENPAGVISAMANIGVGESPDDEILNLIKDSSDSLLEVIDNASVLSKVGLEEKIEMEELDLVNMIEQVKAEFKSHLENAGMNLECELPGRLIIKANPILAEVFKNYVSNAIKYAQDGKRIFIESNIVDNSVTIEVNDYGSSIPEEEYDNIFKRSIQLNKEKKQGRGLGLAIVKRIAEAHNAEVGVKPNKPTGNIFYITFQTKQAGTIELKAVKQSPSSNPVALVVEDSIPNMNYLLIILKKFNISAVSVQSGEEALQVLNDKQFDVMLLDIALGKGISGVTLMEKFREMKKFKNIPIIAVTAFEKRTVEKVKPDGFSDILRKPYTPDQLQDMLMKYNLGDFTQS